MYSCADQQVICVAHVCYLASACSDIDLILLSVIEPQQEQALSWHVRLASPADRLCMQSLPGTLEFVRMLFSHAAVMFVSCSKIS